MSYIWLLLAVLTVFAFVGYTYMMTCYYYAKFLNTISSETKVNITEHADVQDYLASNAEVNNSIQFIEKIGAGDIDAAQAIAQRKDSFSYVNKDDVFDKLRKLVENKEGVENLKRQDAIFKADLRRLAERYYYYQNEIRFIFRKSKLEMPEEISENENDYIFYETGYLEGLPVVGGIEEFQTKDEALKAIGGKGEDRFSKDISYTKWRVKGMDTEFIKLFTTHKERGVSKDESVKNDDQIVADLKELASQNILEQFYQTTPKFCVYIYNSGIAINNFFVGYIDALHSLPKVSLR